MRTGGEDAMIRSGRRRGARTAGGLRRLSPLLALALAACPPPAARAPAFEVGIWPGEGRPQFESVGAELALRETPDRDAAVVRRLSPPAGAAIAFDETRYRTTSPGLLEVVRPITVRGRNLGPVRSLSRDRYYTGDFPRDERELAPGDTVEFLQHRAEGTCFVRLDGDVVEADVCPTHHEDAVRAVAEAEIEWWIRVVEDEEPAGWLLVEDAAVRQVGRTF
jgi:hypothetical protein